MLRTSLLLAAAATASLLIAACGDGDDSMSLEEYLQAVEAQLQQADEASEAVFDDPEFTEIATGTGELTDDDRDVVRAALERIAGAFDDFIEEVDSLNPPGDLEEEHEEFVAAYRSLQEQFESQILTRVDEAATVEELDQSFAALGDAGERTNAACSALQSAADEEDVAVSLNC